LDVKWKGRAKYDGAREAIGRRRRSTKEAGRQMLVGAMIIEKQRPLWGIYI